MDKKRYGSSKKYHFLYRTVNLINGKYYYGMHSTDNLEDGYLGSGTLFRKSLKKYGKENFKLEILEFFENREALAEAERELIKIEKIGSQECMNLKPGGFGGFTSEIAKRGRQATDQKLRERYGEGFRQIVGKKYREGLSEQEKKAHSNKIKEGLRKARERGWKAHSFLGSHHSEETKQKVREARKRSGANLPERTSGYGTCWISNERENKRIKRGEDIPEGWKRGKILKKKPTKYFLLSCEVCGEEVFRLKKRRHTYCEECACFSNYRNFFNNLGVVGENLLVSGEKAHSLITIYLRDGKSYSSIARENKVSINSIVNFLEKYQKHKKTIF